MSKGFSCPAFKSSTKDVYADTIFPSFRRSTVTAIPFVLFWELFFTIPVNELLYLSSLSFVPDMIKSEDFIAVKLTDENFIIDPYNRLKQNFPNLLEIEFLNLNLEVKEGFKVSKKMEPGLLFKKFYRFVVGNDLEEMQIKLLNNVIEKIKTEKVNWKRKIFVRLKKYLNCEGKNFIYIIFIKS